MLLAAAQPIGRTHLRLILSLIGGPIPPAIKTAGRAPMPTARKTAAPARKGTVPARNPVIPTIIQTTPSPRAKANTWILRKCRGILFAATQLLPATQVSSRFLCPQRILRPVSPRPDWQNSGKDPLSPPPPMLWPEIKRFSQHFALPFVRFFIARPGFFGL